MPLNEDLHNRLVQKFGSDKVNIVRRFEPHVPNWQIDPITGRFHREPLSDGEAYQLNCPYCGDKKSRLYVNHFWMQWDQEVMRHADDLIRCFNETNCFSDHNLRLDFFHSLFAGMDVSDIKPITTGVAPVVEEIKARPPGTVVPVNKLPADHPCTIYLKGRKFDPDQLAHWWNVGYLTEVYTGYSQDYLHRIYIPMYHDGELVGYQCRYVGDKEWTRESPKTRTMFGMKRGRHFYNLDVAKQSRVVVLVEGPTSAWAVGPRAIALWGRSITAQQVELLKKHWGKDCLLVVLLDGDAALDSDKITVKIRTHHPDLTVAQVKIMDNNADPGILGEAACWGLIDAECSKRNICLANYFSGANVVLRQAS